MRRHAQAIVDLIMGDLDERAGLTETLDHDVRIELRTTLALLVRGYLEGSGLEDAD